MAPLRQNHSGLQQRIDAMLPSKLTILLSLLTILTTLPSAAQIYRWVDENGKVHFSDKKPETREAETVSVEAPPVLPPDEGELRRRELLRRAEADFQYKRRRAAEEDARTQALEQEIASRQNTQQAKCDDARIRLGVLGEPMPVYWTSSGEMRPAWTNDVYKGDRRYIDDGERPALRAAAERDMQTHCANPEDGNAQYFTYRYWEHQQWCLALKADIVDAQQPRMRTPKEEIETLQAKFKREC